ncbi:MAG: hypothetical protein MUE70_03550 [Desulfobacterales bacterium]|jgi:hypothetical protein|nr:hypothetical protein [Desulfobacterales bacterium]
MCQKNLNQEIFLYSIAYVVNKILCKKPSIPISGGFSEINMILRTRTPSCARTRLFYIYQQNARENRPEKMGPSSTTYEKGFSVLNLTGMDMRAI